MDTPPIPAHDVFECPVCGRECDWVEGSRHHVLPKSQGGRGTETICRDCHRQIHRLFTVKELARQYSTLEKLRAAPEMQTWIAWVRKRPAQSGRRPQMTIRNGRHGSIPQRPFRRRPGSTACRGVGDSD